MVEVIFIGEKAPDFVSARIQGYLSRQASKYYGQPTLVEYSHVAILVDGVDVYHATGKGFHRETLPEVLAMGPSEIRARYVVPLSAEQRAYAEGWLHAKLDCQIEYSNAQYVGFLFPWSQRFVRNGGKRTICSEEVGKFLRFPGNVIDNRLLDCDFVHPFGIEVICQRHLPSGQTSQV